MHDKARLGSRFTCFKCGTKFYDLNRPVSLCPECEADQADAPQRDMKSMLSSKGAGRRRARPAPVEEPTPVATDDEDGDDDDDGDEEEGDEISPLLSNNASDGGDDDDMN